MDWERFLEVTGAMIWTMARTILARRSSSGDSEVSSVND